MPYPGTNVYNPTCKKDPRAPVSGSHLARVSHGHIHRAVSRQERGEPLPEQREYRDERAVVPQRDFRLGDLGLDFRLCLRLCESFERLRLLLEDLALQLCQVQSQQTNLFNLTANIFHTQICLI
jgi:hypothetical protein